MTLRTTFVSALARLQALTGRLAFLAPALIRVTVGTVFIGTGWGKLHDLPQVTSFFAELGIPAPGFNAALAAGTEFFGGLLVLLGLGARLASLPLAFTMVVAIATAKRGEVDGFASLAGLEEWSYLVMFLVLALLGPGPLSVHGLVQWWLRRRAAAAELPRPLHRPAPVPVGDH